MDQLDEALERLAPTGPEWGGGLSNHGPMAAEALVLLGFEDAVPGWVSRYLPRLDGRERASGRITDWREALGDLRRAADWSAFFAHELTLAPWREVLGTWWPRLVPGLAAGATHGVIRTAHAVRAVAEHETPARRAELADALGYWAAAYVELPGRALAAGTRPLAAAVEAVPIYEGERAGLITGTLGRLETLPEFAQSVTALAPVADAKAAIHELTKGFAGVFLERGRTNTVAYLHAVTAPAAVGSILHELPQQTWRQTHDTLWQVAAAIHSGFARGSVREPLPSGEPPTPVQLAERAVANGDEHAIKLTEACLREHAATGDPLFLHAAARGIELT